LKILSPVDDTKQIEVKVEEAEVKIEESNQQYPA
jgi:hypothetical protein